jgi:type IV pilus assembly protein PilB
MSDQQRSHPFGEIVSVLLDEGVIEEKDVVYAQRIQAKLSTPMPLVNILKDLKLLTDETVRQTLQRTRRSIRIGELLVELGYLSSDDLQTAFTIQRDEPGMKIGEILVKYHFVDNRLLNQILSIQLGYPLVQPSLAQIDLELIRRQPFKTLQKYLFLPLKGAADEQLVAFGDPTDREAVKAAERALGRAITPCICDRKELADTLAALQKAGKQAKVAVDPQSVVGIVNTIILDAVKADASDIHIEPSAERIVIRFRQDGVLIFHQELSRDILASLVSRIKILCQADIAERRRHQGGRLLFDHPEGQIDIRASFYVTIHGEKVVLRLLRQKQELLDIRFIGMAPRILTRFLEEAVYQPSGVLLVTGPTGSGKTSTIYSCLHHIKNPQISIVTAEEPVEYVIDGIAQCSIDPAIGVTFEETLRHIVRQDPDVIMIGEIRDKFSADMAVQAALTGHKVLSTFHTEDSIGGLIRLLNMDIAPFLVSSTVISVLAQRLLRRTCPECAVPAKVTPAQLQRLSCTPEDLYGGTFRRGRGCAACNQTGYRGRVGVFELLVLDAQVRDAILEHRTSYEIRTLSIEHTGLVTLMEDGLAKAATGITTIDEVLRCLPKLSKPRPLSVIQRLCGQPT